MDLLDKLDKVEIKTIDRFPPDDMEYCRQAEKDYHDAYNIYSEFSYLSEDVSESIGALADKLYIQKIEDSKDKVYDCNERFISKICGYFRKKYAVTVDAPSWKITEELSYRNPKERYDAVPLKYILDSVYEQMGGMSFEEKAFLELKEDAKEALTTYHDKKSKYRIKGTKLVIDDFYASHKSHIWERYMASVQAKHHAFFKALTHFEYDDYYISQKYNFLCDYQLDEDKGVYDKHFISSSVIDTIKLYKNGKIEIDFKDHKTVAKFISTYFPGIPQAAA